jgi:hypothetical protein
VALPLLADVDALSDWMGVAITNDARAEAILAAASTLVRAHTGRTWVEADGSTEEDVTDLELERVRTVVVLVAERVWSNPRGITQQATGPFSQSVAAWSTFGLALTDPEKDMLPTDSSAKPALWTLGTTRSDELDVSSIYVDVVGTDEPLPIHPEPW